MICNLNNNSKFISILIILITLFISSQTQVADIHTNPLQVIEPIAGIKFEESQANVEPLIASAETSVAGYFAISEDLGIKITSNKYVQIYFQGETEFVKYFKQIPLTKYLLVVFETKIKKIDIQAAFACGKSNGSSCTYDPSDNIPTLDIATAGKALKFPLILSQGNKAALIEYDSSDNNTIKYLNYETMTLESHNFSLNGNEIVDFSHYTIQDGSTTLDMLVLGAGQNIYVYQTGGLKVGETAFGSGHDITALAYIEPLKCILASDTEGKLRCFDSTTRGLDLKITLTTLNRAPGRIDPIKNSKFVLIPVVNLHKVAIIDVENNQEIKSITHTFQVGDVARYITGTGHIVFKKNLAASEHKYEVATICDDSVNQWLGIRTGTCQTCGNDDKYYRACRDCPEGSSFDFIKCTESECLPNCPVICKASNCIEPKIFTPPTGDLQCTCNDPPPPTPTPVPTPVPTPIPTPIPEPVVCVDGQWKDTKNNVCKPCFTGCPKCIGPLQTDCLIIPKVSEKKEDSIPYPIQIIIGVAIIYFVCLIVTIALKKVKQSKSPEYQNVDQESHQSLEEINKKEQKNFKKVNVNKIVPENAYPVIHEDAQENYNSNNHRNQRQNNNFYSDINNNNRDRPNSQESYEVSASNPSNNYNNNNYNQNKDYINQGNYNYNNNHYNNNQSSEQFLDTQQDFVQNQGNYNSRPHSGQLQQNWDQEPPNSGRKYNKGTKLPALNVPHHNHPRGNSPAHSPSRNKQY